MGRSLPGSEPGKAATALEAHALLPRGEHADADLVGGRLEGDEGGAGAVDRDGRAQAAGHHGGGGGAGRGGGAGEDSPEGEEEGRAAG